MKVLNALLALSIAVVVLAGTAGLSSLRGEDGCLNHPAFDGMLDEGSGRDARWHLSLWPPGAGCQLVAGDGTVLDEAGTSAAGFLALLPLWAALLVLLLRFRRPAPLPLRVAVVASVGLLVWGVLNLEFGALGGAGISVLYLFAPLAGFAVDRRLRRAGGGRTRRTDGLLGLVVGPAAIVVGLVGWFFVSGPLSAAVTVALFAAAAGLVDRTARRLAPREVRPA